ncbi:uncharacterized protein LOC142363208 [Opisthocomus hoazin]|uniref:uncharacterized protein LOC142363208 n=1 Tax=Opisthocomus hoazin TaxID=30419 RepID=UPI003F52DC92
MAPAGKGAAKACLCAGAGQGANQRAFHRQPPPARNSQTRGALLTHSSRSSLLLLAAYVSRHASGKPRGTEASRLGLGSQHCGRGRWQKRREKRQGSDGLLLGAAATPFRHSQESAELFSSLPSRGLTDSCGPTNTGDDEEGGHLISKGSPPKKSRGRLEESRPQQILQPDGTGPAWVAKLTCGNKVHNSRRVIKQAMTVSSPDLTHNPVEATSTSEGCDGCIWSKRIRGRPITARCSHPTAMLVNVQLE